MLILNKHILCTKIVLDSTVTSMYNLYIRTENSKLRFNVVQFFLSVNIFRIQRKDIGIFCVML